MQQVADIARNEVRLPTGALRHTGEYNVDVQLHSDVVVTVKVTISSEAQLQAQAEAAEADKARACCVRRSRSDC